MFLKVFKNTLVFGCFACLTSGTTAIINELTKYEIHSQIEKENRNSLAYVLPLHLYNNNIQKECYSIKNKVFGDRLNHKFWIAKKNNKIKAIAIEITTREGYSGFIKILLGMDIYGNILGIRVIEHHETPGLGDKISTDISNWITYFSGMHVFGLIDNHFKLKKYGGQIDQFTGATITPQAIINIIKKSVVSIVQISSMISHCNVCGKDNEIQ
ncbi:MAG TPA: electron transport complex subunit RsxG [Buchnera sp. (in: enterobacteria)]|nr:electron transport complex subunit RsxG [Buchnera sp. (in: enterobacteria)]